VVPNRDKLEEWAGGNGISARGDVLLQDPAATAKIEEESLGKLDGYARFERPKKVALLAAEFTVEDGILTPTQKVKRRVVEERFSHTIQGLYDSGDEDENEADV
jgi:long-chain acyl-CoA synthetase